MAKLSILKRNGDMTATYSTYAAARLASVSGDLIQIWADLTETINLKDKVDIWIMPGVMLDYNPALPGPTITDNNFSVECNIYGMGIIKNTFYNGSIWYECILISHTNSKIFIECDNIEGLGGVFINPPSNASFFGYSVRVNNALKFHLNCKRVISKNSIAIWIGINSIVNDVNLKINSIETGMVSNNNTGSSGLIISGIGYIKYK